MNNYAGQKLSSDRLPVGVVAPRGYAGLELVRILLQHPHVSLQACFSGDSALRMEDYLPAVEAAQLTLKSMQDLAVYAGKLHTVFLATPAEVSLELAPKLLEAGTNVIDLSGAFRLENAEDYRKWYKLEHTATQLLEQALYGLHPYARTTAKLVANPGCYATSILLAILPLLQNGVIDPATLVIDAKSGTSGAGRKAAENLLFTEVDGECLPYRVGRHQHLPEIQLAAKNFAQAEINPFMTTHLLPVRRGIISSVYARLKSQDVAKAYAQAYGDSKLISVRELDSPDSNDTQANRMALSLRQVVGTAKTQIAYSIQGDHLYVFSLIDNLMKGAASQAVENFNHLAGLPTETALTDLRGIL